MAHDVRRHCVRVGGRTLDAAEDARALIGAGAGLIDSLLMEGFRRGTRQAFAVRHPQTARVRQSSTRCDAKGAVDGSKLERGPLSWTSSTTATRLTIYA